MFDDVQEKTGQFDFKAGKKERQQLKAGKGTGGAPKSSLWLICLVLVLGAFLLAGLVYYMATLELEGEEEIEETAHKEETVNADPWSNQLEGRVGHGNEKVGGKRRSHEAGGGEAAAGGQRGEEGRADVEPKGIAHEKAAAEKKANEDAKAAAEKAVADKAVADKAAAEKAAADKAAGEAKAGESKVAEKQKKRKKEAKQKQGGFEGSKEEAVDKRKRPVSDAGGRAKEKQKREEEVGGGGGGGEEKS